MAERDFANLDAPTPEDVRPMSQTKVLFLVLLALAVVAGGFAIGFMLGQEIGEEKANSEEKERLVKQLKLQQEELAKLRAEAKQRVPQVSTTEVGELTFYNELPKQSVEPEPLTSTDSKAEKALPKERVPAATADRSKGSSEALLKQIIERELGQNEAEPRHTVDGQYYLQLASFQKRADAEGFYPQLAKSGFKGLIKQVEVAGRGKWYRVYAGPYVSQRQAEQARSRAKEKLKISGLVVKGD